MTEHRRRVTLPTVLLALPWGILAAWSVLADPNPTRTLRILDGLELGVPKWWSWSLAVASFALPALVVPTAFIWWNPGGRRRAVLASLLIAFPIVVFVGSFLAWRRIHYVFQ